MSVCQYHHFVTCMIVLVCVTSRFIVIWRARSCQYVRQIVSSLRHVHDRVSMCDKSFHRYMACTVMSVGVTNRHHYITCMIMSVCVTNRTIITQHAWSCKCNKLYHRYITCMIMSVCDKSYHHYITCMIMSVCDKSYHHYITWMIMSVCVTNKFKLHGWKRKLQRKQKPQCLWAGRVSDNDVITKSPVSTVSRAEIILQCSASKRKECYELKLQSWVMN